MSESKPKKKQGWEYAQEARKAKLATPDHAAASGKKVQVSTPDTDFNSRVRPVNFQKRAGLQTYAQELEQRLSDIEDVTDAEYFLLPVKLPKKVYKMLLSQAVAMSEVSPDWTERDMLEAIVLFSDAGHLTKVKNKA